MYGRKIQNKKIEINKLVLIASKFQSSIYVEYGEDKYNVNSIMSFQNIEKMESFQLVAEGVDAEQAIMALEALYDE